MRKLILFFLCTMPFFVGAQNNSQIHTHGILEGSAVKMADNSTKRIEKINVGDKVLSFDSNGELTPQKVKALHSSTHRIVYRVRLKDGKNLVVTDDQTLWTNSGWKSIDSEKTASQERYKNQKISTLKIENTTKVLLGDNDTTSSEVIEIDQIKKKADTFILILEDDSAFIVNGIIVGQ